MSPASSVAVAVAVEPFSDADAGKRIFDAARPLKTAGIGNLAALDAVAAAMRSVVTGPMVKGEVAGALTARMDPPRSSPSWATSGLRRSLQEDPAVLAHRRAPVGSRLAGRRHAAG